MKQWAEQHIRGAAARFQIAQNHKKVLEMMRFPYIFNIIELRLLKHAAPHYI